MNKVFKEKKTPCYIINLKHRSERKESVINEFEDRGEFNAIIVEAVAHNSELLAYG